MRHRFGCSVFTSNYLIKASASSLAKDMWCERHLSLIHRSIKSRVPPCGSRPTEMLTFHCFGLPLVSVNGAWSDPSFLNKALYQRHPARSRMIAITRLAFNSGLNGSWLSQLSTSGFVVRCERSGNGQPEVISTDARGPVIKNLSRT